MPAQSQQMHSSQPSQYHTQTSAFPCQPELNDNWTEISSEVHQHKMKLKQTKESEHWLNQTSTSNRYTALLEEESDNQ
jgi:hypothetical protein